LLGETKSENEKLEIATNMNPNLNTNGLVLIQDKLSNFFRR
jgi:hypothetical protein